MEEKRTNIFLERNLMRHGFHHRHVVQGEVLDAKETRKCLTSCLQCLPRLMNFNKKKKQFAIECLFSKCNYKGFRMSYFQKLGPTIEVRSNQIHYSQQFPVIQFDYHTKVSTSTSPQLTPITLPQPLNTTFVQRKELKVRNHKLRLHPYFG